MSNAHFAMISEWMTNGNVIEFVKANPDANRLKLVIDVRIAYLASGCREGIDLHPSTWDGSRRPQGANVVIDQACRARLADFGLLTVVSDSINLFSSSTTDTHGGTLRWMSPELIAPEKFGTKTSRPTRASDCYSLGMVVYETVSESIPFHKVHHWAIYGTVAEGKHPSRGVCFTDDLWEVMEQYWMSHPDRRPSVECVLECLETLSIGGDPGLNSLISAPTGYPDNLRVWSPLFNTSQDMGGVELRAVPDAPISGGTSSIVLLDNQPVNVPTTLNMETASQHALLRIPLESTARLLNNFRPAPQAEGDEGTLRRAEEDGVDVDARAQPHAGPSGDAREQTLDVPRVQLYDGSKSAVFVCGWSPTNKNILATGTKDALVHIWNLPPGSEDSSLATPLTSSYFPDEEQRDITCLDWSPDGKIVATGAMDGRLRLCTASAELYMENAQQLQAFLALKFSPSGKWLPAGGLNPTVHLWDIANETLEKQCSADNASCLDVAWIDDSRFVICGGDKVIYVFQLNATKPVHTLNGHTNEINKVECNPSSTSLASCSHDGTARTWNLQTGTSVVCAGHGAELVSVRWCPQTQPGKDELIATCAKDMTTRIWNSMTGECLKVFADHTESFFSLAFCPSGRWVATGGADGGIHVYDMQVSLIDWQDSGGVNRFAFVLESGKVGVVDLAKTPEFFTIKGSS